MSFENSLFDNSVFNALYGVSAQQARRYERIRDGFAARFAGTPAFFSTSGRTEIIGNHTDHNGGRVLAGSISLDTVAAASPSGDMLVTMVSEGFSGEFKVDLSCLDALDRERGSTNALIRGVAARFKLLGYCIGGFNAYVSSNVLRGSGLSSSASVEVLICTIFSSFFNSGTVSPEQMGEISQFAENRYFGKPCGLMDQLACACGNITAIDFGGQTVDIRRIEYDFARRGYSLIITDVHEDHADLTDQYAAIIGDMRAAAEYFGAARLRDVDYDEFLCAVPRVRKVCGDRAVLRAIHFFEENLRVDAAVDALEKGELGSFFDAVNASGESSWCLLQNLCVPGSSAQAIPLALTLAKRMLADRGAVRVHGGGFGGTTLAFVPMDLKSEYISKMDSVFGADAACELSIRALSTARVL